MLDQTVQAFFLIFMKTVVRRQKKRSAKKTRRRSYHWLALCIIAVSAIVAVIVSIAQLRADKEEIMGEIRRYAAKHKIPAEFVAAVVNQESGFDSLATGRAGEIGLMQLMPPGKPGAPEEWARVYKVKCPSRLKLYRVNTNINIGSWYLARAIRRWKRYRCAYELALVEYNAGQKYAELYKPETLDGDVVSRIKIPSTKKYVIEIMKNYRDSR